MYPNQMRGRGSGMGAFLIFLVVGLYFLNAALNFFPIPPTLLANKVYNQALNLIAGVLIIIGGFKFLFQRRMMY